MPPIGFERGEIEPFLLVGTFDIAGGIGSRELARRLRWLEAIELEVVCWYRRPDLLRPSRRRSVPERLSVRVDPEPLKRRIARHWEGHADYAEAAAIIAGS